MNQITDNIWIGDSHDARNAEALRAAGITAILNVAHDLRDVLGWPEFHLAHCGLIDGPGNRLEHYVAAVNQLIAFIKDGHRVLIHCHAGHSRSVSVAIMYLDRESKFGWEHWRAYIRERRPTMLPHDPNPPHKEFHLLMGGTP